MFSLLYNCLHKATSLFALAPMTSVIPSLRSSLLPALLRTDAFSLAVKSVSNIVQTTSSASFSTSLATCALTAGALCGLPSTLCKISWFTVSFLSYLLEIVPVLRPSTHAAFFLKLSCLAPSSSHRALLLDICSVIFSYFAFLGE